jgi:competence protein ComFC
MSSLKMFHKAAQACVDLIYPPICLSCGDVFLEDDDAFLCLSCREALIPLSYEERCPYCFSGEYEGGGKKRCRRCIGEERVIYKKAAVFYYGDTAAAIVKKMKYSYMPFLAEGMGAYMASQLLTMQWPQPEYIVPVPLSPIHSFSRGYNQSLLLAKAVGGIIDVPVCDMLWRDDCDIPQTAKDYKQRRQIVKSMMKIKKGKDVAGKVVLIVDDVMTTGATLHRCALALMEQGPRAVYSLTFCMA